MGGDYNVVIERDEEGHYIASVPVLPGCHTHGRSEAEALERIREAIEAYLEVRGGEAVPLDFVRVHKVTIAA